MRVLSSLLLRTLWLIERLNAGGQFIDLRGNAFHVVQCQPWLRDWSGKRKSRYRSKHPSGGRESNEPRLGK